MFEEVLHLQNKGDFVSARKLWRHALANGYEGKERAEALNGHALCDLALGNNQNAYDNLREALEIDPDRWEYKLHMAQAALRLTEPMIRYKYEAIDAAREAAKMSNDPRVWAVFANTLKHFDRYTDAVIALEHLRKLDPTNPTIPLTMADILTKIERFEEAKQLYIETIELDPNNADAHVLLSSMYAKEEGQPEKCYYHAKMGLSSPSRGHIARWNMGLCQLSMGEFEEGWKNYETRLILGEYLMKELSHLNKRFGDKPIWDGQSKGWIHIHPEQGFGDMLQFCRYVPLLQQMGNKVTFETHAQMRSLLAHSFPGVEVLPKSKDWPSTDGIDLGFDYHIPLMSLPAALKTTIETIPQNIPYLKAEPHRIARWAKKFTNLKGLKVGLCWAGENRPHDQAMFFHNQTRSMGLKELQPLLEVEGVEFVSLQMGKPGLQAKDYPKIHDWTDQIWEFSDTAAIIHHLDLVISVCTSVAHLAGGMGCNLWIMNKRNACWRWMQPTGRNDSPWYPGAKLFRQPEKGDWASVINEVKSELEGLIRAR